MSEPAQPALRNGAKRAAREERLAKALRDNLRRRKEQARAQQRLGTPPAGPQDTGPQDKGPQDGGETPA